MSTWIDRKVPHLCCLAIALAWAPATGCLPGGSEGECSATNPCTERGQQCNLSTRVCEAVEVNTDSLDPDYAGGSFGPLALPFFRGRVCMPTAVKTGDPIPVKIEPCLHPCVDIDSFHFSQKYMCNDSDCELILAQWFMASGAADCPADALERFDKATCAYPQAVDAVAGPIKVNGLSLSGEMELELPFLNLSEADEFADDISADRAFEIVKSYPDNPDRRLPISIQPDNADAPADCQDESQCNCVEFGF